MAKLAMVATTLLAVFGGGQPMLAEEAISEPRCVCGPSTGAGLLNAGRPIFSDLADASASERNSRVDGRAPMPQTLSRLGRVRYPGDHDRRTLPYTVEPIDVSHRE
jgi:hypothetical protein